MPTTLLRDKHIEYILSLQDVWFLVAAAGPPSPIPTRGLQPWRACVCVWELCCDRHDRLLSERVLIHMTLCLLVLTPSLYLPFSVCSAVLRFA